MSDKFQRRETKPIPPGGEDVLDRITAWLVRNAVSLGVAGLLAGVGTGHFIKAGWASPYTIPWLSVLLLFLVLASWRFVRPNRISPRHEIEFLGAVAAGLTYFIHVTGAGHSPLRPASFLLVAMVAAALPIWINISLIALLAAVEGASRIVPVYPGIPWPEIAVDLGATAGFQIVLAVGLGWIVQAEVRHKDSWMGRFQRLTSDAETFDPLVGSRGSETALAMEDEARLTSLVQSAQEFDRVLADLLDTIKEAIPSNTVVLFTRREGEDALEMKAVLSCGEAIDRAAVIPVGVGYMGWVAREMKPLHVAELKGDIAPLGYYASAEPVESFLAVPLVDQGYMRGVLAADSTERGAFSKADENLLARFAVQIVYILRKMTEQQQIIQIARSSRVLSEIAEAIGRSLDVDQVLNELLGKVGGLIPYDSAWVVLTDPAGGGVVRAAAGMADSDRVVGQAVDVRGGVFGLMMENRHPVLLSRLEGKAGQGPFASLGGTADAALRSFLGVPFVLQERVLGFLLFGSFTVDRLNGFHQSVGGLLAKQIAYQIDNAELHKRLEQQAVTDSLTGLLNRRRFDEKVEEEMERVARAGGPLSLGLLDIDHFKRINDTFGHPVGDAVLKIVAQAILEQVRAVDAVARYGGEEFALLLVETDTAGARKTMERIRMSIEKGQYMLDGREVPVTVSLGFTTCAEGRASAGELMGEADRALYHAKETGRNRTCAFTELAGRGPEPVASGGGPAAPIGRRT
jgi:diguanylate cyclase (GGDEF)-like protein